MTSHDKHQENLVSTIQCQLSVCIATQVLVVKGGLVTKQQHIPAMRYCNNKYFSYFWSHCRSGIPPTYFHLINFHNVYFSSPWTSNKKKNKGQKLLIVNKIVSCFQFSSPMYITPSSKASHTLEQEDTEKGVWPRWIVAVRCSGRPVLASPSPTPPFVPQLGQSSPYTCRT